MGLFDDVLKPSNVQNQDDTTQPAQTDQASSSGMFDDILKPKDRTIGSVAKDVGITALKGAISLPEAAVGVADIVTGGEAGKTLEGIGFRPKEAKAILDEGYSEKQKLANAKLQNADGFVDTVATAVQNPSTIVNAAIESAPLILGGGAIGAGARALKASPVIAGAVGEGIVGAGMAAEGTRQQTEDGLLTDKQAALSALSGVGTAALGAAGGKLAQKLKITDIDTAATGAVGEASKDGLLKRTVKGALGEGVFEELPQSVQEQILSNAALDKPLFEGVDNAAAMGMLTGGVMGGGISAINPGNNPAADNTPAPDTANQQQEDAANAAPLDDFEAFKQQSEATIEQRKVAAGIKKPAENIDAADILGDSNVNDTANAVAGLATAAGDLASDNVQGSVADLPIQSDGRGLGDVTETLTQSIGSNQPIGNAGRGNDAVAQAKEGDIVTIGDSQFKKTANGFERVTPDVTNVVDNTTNDGSNNSSFSGAMAADYLLTGGFGVMESTEYLLQAYSGLSQKSSQAVENIRKKYAQQIIDSKLTEAKDFVKSDLYNQIIGEMKSAISKSHNGNPLVDEIFADINKYPTGMSPKVGDKISAKIIQLESETATPQSNVDSVNTIQDHVDETAKDVQMNDVAPVSNTPKTASWVVRNKETGEPIMETYQKSVADKVNTDKYESVPILQHLQELNEEGSKARNYAQRDTIKQDSSIEVAGEKINKEWTAFNPDTGTLNIPRAEMPQIKAEHRGAMVNFLNARGISHEQETVPASSLKPTQQEFSEAKVKQASEYVGGDRSILVSSDNHVLDGHHQWLSKLQNNDNVDVIRLNAPIKDLLTNVSEFPSAQVAEGAKEVSTPKPKAAKPKAPKIKSLLTTINDLGGILNSEKLDITGEQRGFAPGGYNKIFKLNSKRSLKGLIEGGDLDEYLPYNMRLEANGANDDAFDSTEAYDYLADKIRNGESVLPYAVEEELRALQYEGNAVNDVADELTEDEINGQLQQASNEERESATNARVFNTDSENGGARSSERTESATETNTDQQAEVAPESKQDLLGDDTAAKQAIADAERAKDTKRNSGNDNQDTFTLTGSNSEADQAAAAGAQDLFAAPKAESNPQDEVVKATESLTAAGVKGKEKLDTIKDVREGKVTADEVADAYAAPTAQEEKVQTPLSLYDNAMDEYGQGIANADDYKAAFNYVINNKEAITEYLEANFTKQQLFDRGGARLESRYKSEKKDRVVSALYADMVSDFLLPGESGLTSYSYGFGEDKYKSIKSQVEAITQESLDKAMARLQDAKKERDVKLAEREEGMQDPKTLDDYTNYLRGKMGDGMSLKEARMTLTPDQRETYDNLYAERTIADRAGRKEAAQTSVSVAGQKVEGSIIETKHTQKGHDLFVVQLSERVSKEDYNTLNSGAKKLGGYYSSFRGRGAVPGFQFTTKENAEAFVQLAGGDNSAAKEQAKERRSAFEDDKSQTAVERLTEMADKLEEKADEELARERKSNTSRRAGMAARAEANASAQKAMAITMRNIAQAIEAGSTKFLGKVRQKVQVELLQSLTSSAQYTKMREQYPAYGDYEKHQHDAPTKDTADYSEFPTYSLYRSDLANLGRSMVEIDGLKILGNRILSVADDVTDAYLKFAKDNIHKVSRYKTSDGKDAVFASKAMAESAISRSGFKGKAIVFPFKRGQNMIIDSPSAAQERGIWDGDSDKKITLSADLGKDIVEKVGKANRRQNKLNMPWQFENAYDKREKLVRMGIETPAEMRAALREFIGLKEQAKQPDKIKELERKMLGRRNDGLDFFPTPASTADEMIDAADIKEGMSVLEPSAGMGHIAERIRESGNEPDVVEFSGDRRELLELKGFNVVGSDFLDITEKYDRIIMNPPFSNRRDEEHIRHAYSLLKPNGKLVAIMGEGVFFGSDKRATEFRDWLESVGGTSEKLEEGTFKDASLPVNTSVNARMVVVEKQEADNDGVAMFSRGNSVSTPIFYSALSNAIGEIKTNKAQGSIWKGMIKNLTQKGVKPDEIEWTGVNEWLDLQQDSVTKEQVVDYLNSNGVQVTETMLGENFEYNFLSDEENSRYESLLEIKENSWQEGARQLTSDESKELNKFTKRLREHIKTDNPTKYDKYTVAGGENYKELLLTLPEKKIIVDGFEITETDTVIYEDKGLEKPLKVVKVIPKKFTEASAEASKFIADNSYKYEYNLDYNDGESVIDSLKTYGFRFDEAKFESSHFDQPNILAHVRFDERVDADGNKVLFINEIQSDWGQEGKKKGFNSKISEEDAKKQYKEFSQSMFDKHGFDWLNKISVAEYEQEQRLNRLVEEAKGIKEKRGVQPAPFVTKTDAWVSLALKRMIRYAAENGFDKVALINGQQAADLYSLRKQVETVSAVDAGNGTWNISADSANGNTVMNEYAVPTDKVADYLGKEVAESLLKSEPSQFGVRKLTGQQLEIGGTGMAVFYDSIVPKVAKDVLKKLGGELSKTTINGNEKEVKPSWTSTESESKTDPTEQLSFTITPEMREKILGGLPLFNRESNVVPAGLPKATIQKAVNLLKSNWKNAPEIIVVQDMNDPAIRTAVREENDRQLSQGAAGQPEGFFDAGKVYIVASEMNSAADVVRVMFHETLGHYGLRGTFGKELSAILDRVALLRKADMAKKAKQYGLDLTKVSDKRIAAEEVLAEMAQTAPQLSFVKSAIVAIRKFLRSIGVKLDLSDNEIINDYIIPARSFVVNGANKQQSVSGMVAAFNRDQNDISFGVQEIPEADAKKLVMAWTKVIGELGDTPYRYPVSMETDLDKVAKEVSEGEITVTKVRNMGDDNESNYILKSSLLPNNTTYVTETDNEVWINVADSKEGSGGSLLYTIVGNYAANNGKVFIGDPEGITSTAIIRRMVNMTSLATKFGATDFIKPHKDQLQALGKYGLSWKTGDDQFNLAHLLFATYNVTKEQAPGIENVEYNRDTGDFTNTITGEQFTDDDFEKLAQDIRGNVTEGAAGSGTLKIAATIGSILREEAAGRSWLANSGVGNGAAQVRSDRLTDALYSRSTPQTETPQFKSWFGNSKVVDANGKPLVVYHGSEAGDFTEFNKDSFFSPDKTFAEDYGDTRAFYLSVKNPFNPKYYDQLKTFFNAVGSIEDTYDGSIIYSADEFVESDSAQSDSWEMLEPHKEAIKRLGFDGMVVTEGGVANYLVFEPEQIKSATDNNGDFDATNSDVRFSRNNPQQSLTPAWNAPETSKLDSIVYTLQDKHVDLKRVTQAIKAAGTEITDRWNAYLQEELYHGRTAKRTKDFIKNDLNPLIEDMRMRGVAMADFEEFLWARHAEERNMQIAKVNPKMPDSGSGMSTKDARDYLENLSPVNKAKYEALAKRVDAINRKSRQVLLDYGLESADTIAAWEGAYKNYVPLMREDMDAGFGNGTGQGFSVKGNASKRATGSNRAVVDIIANIAQQYEKNVIRGEKNRVSTALIGLAKLNPNEEFWEVDTPPTIKTIVKGGTVYDVLYNGNKAAEFTNKNAALNYINAKGITGYAVDERQAPDHVEYVTDPNYKNRDNVVVARIVNKLGKVEERSVVFNQFDERAMRMAASIKNLDQDQIGELLGTASSFTRYFASINTQYNPIFGVVNITRDIQGALLNLSTTPIADKKTEVLKNTPSALKGIYQDLRSQRKTGQAATNKWATLFEEFQNEGGQTGFRDMYRNAKERGEALKDALDPTWWKDSKIGKVISLNGTIANQEQWIYDKAIKPIFEWLEDYNSALENAVRLSVYKAALDNGHSKQQAASMAKNISVNFNRKGEMGRQIGSLYAFFNASVQGTARIGETMLNRDASGKLNLSTMGKRVIQGGLLLGAMQALMLAAAGFDDDEPPEFVKDRSLIIPIGDGKFITIPMPLGYNAIPSMGRIVTEWMLSGGKDTQKRLIHIVDMLLDVTNPIGNAGLSLQTITPTVIDPLSALAENKDFTGRPISREDFNSLNPTAGFTRSRDKAWDFSVAIARGINWVTGGTDVKQGAISPTADQLEYLAGQFTGGVGREIIKTGTTADSIVTGEELPTYKIPLVGRFYGDSTGQASQGAAFYNNVRSLNEHQAEIKNIKEKGGEVAEYLADNPEAALYKTGDLALRQINSLRKRQRLLKENDADKESIKAIDERITAIMKKLNDRVKLAKEKEAA